MFDQEVELGCGLWCCNKALTLKSLRWPRKWSYNDLFIFACFFFHGTAMNVYMLMYWCNYPFSEDLTGKKSTSKSSKRISSYSNTPDRVSDDIGNQAHVVVPNGFVHGSHRSAQSARLRSSPCMVRFSVTLKQWASLKLLELMKTLIICHVNYNKYIHTLHPFPHKPKKSGQME